MDWQRIGRLLLSLVFAGAAIGFGYAFVTMPYELTVTTNTVAQPNGGGVFLLAVGSGFAALVAAFSGDWR